MGWFGNWFGGWFEGWVPDPLSTQPPSFSVLSTEVSHRYGRILGWNDLLFSNQEYRCIISSGGVAVLRHYNPSYRRYDDDYVRFRVPDTLCPELPRPDEPLDDGLADNIEPFRWIVQGGVDTEYKWRFGRGAITLGYTLRAPISFRVRCQAPIIPDYPPLSGTVWWGVELFAGARVVRYLYGVYPFEDAINMSLLRDTNSDGGGYDHPFLGGTYPFYNGENFWFIVHVDEDGIARVEWRLRRNDGTWHTVASPSRFNIGLGFGLTLLGLGARVNAKFVVGAIETISGAPTGVTVATPVIDIGESPGSLRVRHLPDVGTVEWRASDTAFSPTGNLPEWNNPTGNYRYWQARVTWQDPSILLERIELVYDTGGDSTPEEDPFWQRHRPLWWPRWSKVYTRGSRWNRVDRAVQRNVYESAAPPWFGPQESYETQSLIWYAVPGVSGEWEEVHAANQTVRRARTPYEFHRSYEPVFLVTGSTWLFRNLDRRYVFVSGRRDWDLLPDAAGNLVEDESVYVKIRHRWYRVPSHFIDRDRGAVRSPTSAPRVYSYVTWPVRRWVLQYGTVKVGPSVSPLRLYHLAGYLWEHARFSDIPTRNVLAVSALERQVQLKWAARDLRWRLHATFFPVEPSVWDGRGALSGSGFLVATKLPFSVYLLQARRQQDGSLWVPLQPFAAELHTDSGRVWCAVSGNTLVPQRPVHDSSPLVRAWVQHYVETPGMLTPTTNLSSGEYLYWSAVLPSCVTVSGDYPVIWDQSPAGIYPCVMDVL